MPLYEFQCNDCNEAFSELKKMGDFSADCPVCSSKNTKKLMSSFSSKASSSGMSIPASSGSSCSPGG